MKSADYTKHTEERIQGRNYAWSHSLDLFINPIEIPFVCVYDCECVSLAFGIFS